MTISMEAPAIPNSGYYNGMLSVGSELDENTRETYTQGDCYLLALELYGLGLGELIAVIDGESSAPNRAWSHMAVRLPSGYILDADGVNDPGLILGNYGWNLPEDGTIEAISLEAYAALTGSQAASIHSSSEVRRVAMELQSWLNTLPALPPLAPWLSNLLSALSTGQLTGSA